jgi:hypothetical protein
MKYIRKGTVDAIQFNGDNLEEIIGFCGGGLGNTIVAGQWVVKGDHGFYICPDVAFQLRFEPAYNPDIHGPHIIAK